MNGFDIREGLQIDRPSLFVPWKISEDDLMELFKGYELYKVTNGYYTIPCEVLNGLKCKVGFHFNHKGKLEFFELFDTPLSDIYEDYGFCQKILEAKFGSGVFALPLNKDFPSCTWRFGKISIGHFISERFSLEHHIHIRTSGR